jgi:D-lyxose ketol-isomerase
MDNERMDESGVYIFTKRDFNAISRKYEHKIIYIEKSDSFQKHNRDQHIQDCIDQNGGNCVCLKQIENAKDRQRIEDDLLDNYDTVCNEEPSLIG